MDGYYLGVSDAINTCTDASCASGFPWWGIVLAIVYVLLVIRSSNQ